MEQQAFLLEKAKAVHTKRWEDSQIQAATWQSVLDYAVEQYEQHKEELDEEVITKTEEMIKERQEEIKEFLLKEKDLYLESMGIQAD
jgi:hypothetical protein